MSILKYDKVVLIKEFGKMKMVGETYEVANITDTSFVMRDVKTKVAVGVIGIKEFNECFKKEEEIKKWTPWTQLVDGLGHTIAFYRTNRKKVQVRIMEGIRAEASCNSCDEFNLYFGIQLAYLRCQTKILEGHRKNYLKYLKELDGQIKYNTELMKRMINSLEEKVEE